MPYSLIWVSCVAHCEAAVFVEVAVVLKIYNLVTVCAWVNANLPLLTLWAYVVLLGLEYRLATCSLIVVCEILPVVHDVISSVLKNLRRENIGAVVIDLLVLGN